jgi:uncharacterized repeat protein (TIGR01451 family)
MISNMKNAAAFVAIVAFAAPAFAETSAEMEILRPVTETVMVDGMAIEKTVMQAITSSVPGDILTYRITMTNDDDAPASDIKLVLPLDTNITLIEDTVTATTDFASQYSVTDGDEFADLQDLFVMEDGERRAASADDLRYIQIEIPVLQADEKAVVEYSISVD